MLDKPVKDFQDDEKKIIEQLISSIADKENLVFNAGAGAGKTYALIECLKYICREKRDMLEYHNQKAICITYTNVAANEIKSRLGNTDLVLISTIHERLWDIIKDYQDELIQIHVDNLEEQIRDIEQDINREEEINSLPECQKIKLIQMLTENKKEFYSISNLGAKEFRSEFNNLFPVLGDKKISNANNFIKVCFKMIRQDEYRKCITSIQNKQSGFTQLIYDTRSNRDHLQYMKISHDTLIEYADKIIGKYDNLKRCIIDRYPYFFVDEYQDTNEYVVKIITELERYSKEINHPVFVGYFGDSVQNIYDKGIGANIDKYCNSYKKINKEYNRRSCNEIIELANRIRNDKIKQKSIYEDSQGGNVKVFWGNEDQIKNFISINSQKMINMSDEKSVHCFLLMNKNVAEFSDILELFDWFYKTPFYKTNFNALATELLSNDVNKLGEIPRYIYNLTEFIVLSKKDDTFLLDLFRKELFDSLDIKSVCRIVDCLKDINATTLKTMISSIENFRETMNNLLAGKKSDELIGNCIDSIIGMHDFSYNTFVDYVKRALFREEYDKCDEKIEEFLEFDIQLLERWYHYINMENQEAITYHTFHGTKGLEFDNVIMIFGDEFGNRQKGFFKEYFDGYNKEISDEKLEKYNKARNLLYVAVTRARINLCILYTGDYMGNKEAIDSIFGDINEWDDQGVRKL